jgi:hypothetical protein
MIIKIKNNNKKAGVLTYSIVLTSIALILATVVMGNYNSLIINQKSVEIERNIFENIKSNVGLFSQYLQNTNND